MNSVSASRRAIVVGVDGSPTSDLALDWACGERPEKGCRCISFTHSLLGTR